MVSEIYRKLLPFTSIFHYYNNLYFQDMKRQSSDNSRFSANGPKRYRVDPYNEALADVSFFSSF